MVFMFEECTVMRHMVRYEKRAARLEEGSENAGHVVHVCKVVVGLRALWESRTQKKGKKERE